MENTEIIPKIKVVTNYLNTQRPKHKGPKGFAMRTDNYENIKFESIKIFS